MKLTTNYTSLTGRMQPAFDLAVQDTVKEAQARAKKVTGKWSKSITSKKIGNNTNSTTAVVGSPLASAKAHELGAYITPRTAPRLVFSLANGDVRSAEAVRIPPQPAVIPAGGMFKTFMTKRLQERSR